MWELITIGVPDRRLALMVPRIALVARHRPLPWIVEQRRALDRLVSGLPARLAAIADCGVPDTLVHGDFHPGNVAGPPDRYVILDWGDSFVGHPLIDELVFTERLPPADRVAARGWFVAAWQHIEPHSAERCGGDHEPAHPSSPRHRGRRRGATAESGFRDDGHLTRCPGATECPHALTSVPWSP